MKLDMSLTHFPTAAAFGVWMRTRFARSGAARRVVEESGLPGELADLVLSVSRRTRLWPGEQRDVARELIAHFKDGLEAGRTPENLTADFGDARRASRLMRKSKRRGRPWTWRVWSASVRLAGWSLLTLAGVYGWLGYRYWTAHATISRNYVAEHNAEVRSLSADTRAWPLYRRAALSRPAWPKVLVSPQTGHPGEPSTPPAFGPDITPDSEFWPLMVEYNRACGPMLEMVREAAGRARLGAEWNDGPDWELMEHDAKTVGVRGFRRPGAAEPSEADLPWMTEEGRVWATTVMCRLARDLSFDMLVAAHEKDPARWMSDVKAVLGMVGQMHGAEWQSTPNWECALLSDLCGRVGRALDADPGFLSDEQMEELAHRLAAAEMGVDAERSGRGVQRMFDDVLQHWFTDDGSGNGRITPAGLRALGAMRDSVSAKPFLDPDPEWSGVLAAAKPGLAAVIADRGTQRREFERLNLLAREDAQRPLWDQRGLAVAEVGRISKDPVLRVRLAPVVLLAPWPTIEGAVARLAAAKRDGMLVAIACELYKRLHGVYPESTEDLTPVLLPVVPVDPWCGRPLRVMMRQGRPVVYSTGPDGVDDGGNAESDGVEYVPWREISLVEKASVPKGRDWIIWPERTAAPSCERPPG